MNKRRHELERKELADRLETGIESAQSYIPMILGGIAVVVLAALGWGLWNSSSEKKAAAAWADYYFNMNGGEADTFLDVSDDHSGTAAADWARLTAAAGYLELGLSSIYTDATEAKKQIGLAIEQYETLQNHSNTDLRTKALLGLAQSHESLGDLDAAISAYEDVRKTATQPQLLAKASERIEFLNSSTGKEFYNWFTKLDPKPDAPITLPSDLTTPPSGPGGLEFTPPAGADLPAVDPAAATGDEAETADGASIAPVAPIAPVPPAQEQTSTDASTESSESGLELGGPAGGEAGSQGGDK